MAARKRIKLTKRTIDSLKPGRRYRIVWDAELIGFGVRVYPTGRKTYVIQYRNRAGRSRRLTLGTIDRLTPQEARESARQKLAAVARGADPVEEQQDYAGAPTLRDLAVRYIEQHAIPKKKPSSVVTDRCLLRKHIVPRLGKVKVPDVTLAQVSNLHYEMRDTPIQANRAMGLLSKMLNLAERWGLRPLNSNPCPHIDRYKENRRERFLSGAEVARIGEVLREAEAEGSEHPSAILAIRLLLLTGARKGEILKLRWSEVDFEARCLRLGDSKTGAKVIHLGAPALQLLANAEQIEENPWVCYGVRKGKHFLGLHRIWDRVRKDADLPDVRIHDLRHTHASVGAAAGLSLPIIGKLLGHKTPITTARYAHLADSPVKAAAERITGEIAHYLEGGEPESKAGT